MSYTNVDAKLKPICIKFVNCGMMKSGDIRENFFSQYWTQLGKSSNIKDLKTRILDHLHAAGIKVELEDLRLWLYSKNEALQGQDLKKAIMDVKAGFENP